METRPAKLWMPELIEKLGIVWQGLSPFKKASNVARSNGSRDSRGTKKDFGQKCRRLLLHGGFRVFSGICHASSHKVWQYHCPGKNRNVLLPRSTCYEKFFGSLLAGRDSNPDEPMSDTKAVGIGILEYFPGNHTEEY